MKSDAWKPSKYDQFRKERSQPFYDLALMVQPTNHPPSIVDLGCGPGSLTAELHRLLHASRTLGLDNSDAMLEKAKEFASEEVHFEKADIEAWASSSTGSPSFDAAKFDVIYANASLQWCGAHAALFENIRDRLSPGGQLAVQMPMNGDYPTHQIADEMSRETKWNAKLGGVSYVMQKEMLKPEEYAALMFRLGFREQRVSLNVYPHVLDSREEVVEWVRGTMLTFFQSRLSAEDFAEFVDEFKTLLFQVLPDEKPFFYPFKRVLIWGSL